MDPSSDGLQDLVVSGTPEYLLHDDTKRGHDRYRQKHSNDAPELSSDQDDKQYDEWMCLRHAREYERLKEEVIGDLRDQHRDQDTEEQ